MTADEDWWRCLPWWLKLVTLLVAFPAWAFIVYCVLTGQADSPPAYAAFVVFAICAALHIRFDRRDHGGGQDGSGGLEMSDSGE
jgi:hypothetical protein